MTQEVAQELKRKYHKAWRGANKDKVKSKNERYWKKKASLVTAAENEKGGSQDA